MAAATITNPNPPLQVRITSPTTAVPFAGLTISNPSSRFLVLEYYVENNLIFSTQIGNVTSYSPSFSAANVDDMLQIITIGTGTTTNTYYRLKSYTDGTYTTQDGANQDKTSYVIIDSVVAFRPVFTDYNLENEPKTITVQDSYGNTLDTNDTDDLIGSSDSVVIPGYTKLKATVTVANQAVPQYYSTMDSYRFGDTTHSVDEPFSAVADVELLLDNVVPNSSSQVLVQAADSRGFRTTVYNLCDLVLDYTAVSLFNVRAVRDDNVDSETKLQFEGLVWNKYFANGLTSNPGIGEINTLTCHYRFKETTDTWGAQTWEPITATVDGSGNISFDAYVDGDLGSAGFDSTLAFNIEVRAFDKVTATIVEITLNNGVPIIHATVDGVAVMKQYDTDIGGAFQVGGKTFGDDNVSSPNINSGWNDPELTLTYDSADDPMYLATVPGDLTHLLGSKIRVTQQTTNLRAYYKFSTGAITTDSSGNSFTLSAISDPASVDGKFGQGIELDGNDGYDIGSGGNQSNLMPTGNFTLSAWIKTSTTGATQTIIQSFSQDTNRAGIQLFINSSNFPVLLSGANGVTQGTHWQQVVGVTNVCDGLWHQITGTWDGSTLRIYVDGRLDNSIAWAVAPVYEVPVVGNTFQVIGAARLVLSATNFFTGTLDEVFLMNGTALSEGEVYALAKSDEEFDSDIRKHFLVHLATYDGTDTTLHLFGGTDFDLLNSTISNFRYSRHRTPAGFIMQRPKWGLASTPTTTTQSTPTQNTWYNLGGSLSIPPGIWIIDAYMSRMQIIDNTSATAVIDVFGTLSTANNSESDTANTRSNIMRESTTTGEVRVGAPVQINNNVDFLIETTLYLNARTTSSGITSIQVVDGTIKVYSAYL